MTIIHITHTHIYIHIYIYYAIGALVKTCKIQSNNPCTWIVYICSICSACVNCYAYMCLSLPHTLEVMKNTTYKKCLAIDILTFTKMGTLYHITKNKRALFEKSVLLCLKINDFGSKGVFLFVQNPRKWDVFQTCVRAGYALWSGGAGLTVG